MASTNLIISRNEGVALLTVNRPEALNSLNNRVLGELLEAFTCLGADEGVKAIVVTGSGSKAFVAGADISEMVDMNTQQALEFARTGQKLMAMVGEMTKPVIAAVNGFALGGGLELALACDFIYASENAKMGLPEVTLGIMPGFGGTQKLARLAGRNLANEMIFTGRLATAVEAKEYGIVNAVYPAEELLPKALEAAARIAAQGQLGVAYAKCAIKGGLDMAEGEGMGHEAALFAALFATADQKEGMRAFLDKRKPAFVGA